MLEEHSHVTVPADWQEGRNLDNWEGRCIKLQTCQSFPAVTSFSSESLSICNIATVFDALVFEDTKIFLHDNKTHRFYTQQSTLREIHKNSVLRMHTQQLKFSLDQTLHLPTKMEPSTNSSKAIHTKPRLHVTTPPECETRM
jgi:hypothetical protein